MPKSDLKIYPIRHHGLGSEGGVKEHWRFISLPPCGLRGQCLPAAHCPS